MNQRSRTARARLILLPMTLVLLGTTSLHGATDQHGAVDSARRRLTLRDGWPVKQLETERPNIAALTRESASPDSTWLAASMPAQVHDVLLAHGRIPDPHIGTNAAALACMPRATPCFWKTAAPRSKARFAGCGIIRRSCCGLAAMNSTWGRRAPKSA